MNNPKDSLPLLGRDIRWEDIDGEILHVLDFKPLAKVVDGEVKHFSKDLPYAILDVISFSNKAKAQLWVTHKIDFNNLWRVYVEAGVRDDVEVNVIWTKKQYKSKLVGAFKFAMPRLIVWVNHKGAWKLIHSPDEAKHIGEAAYKAKAPIVELKPDVME
jgi:hypothetical protein